MSISEAAQRGDYEALHVTLASLSADEVTIALEETSSTSPIEAFAQTTTGTSNYSFQAVPASAADTKGNRPLIFHMSADRRYQTKSVEELRYEDSQGTICFNEFQWTQCSVNVLLLTLFLGGSYFYG